MHRLKIYIEIEIFRVDLNIHNSVGEGSFFPHILVHSESVRFCTGENKSYVIGGVGGGRQRSGNISHQACMASDAI